MQAQFQSPVITNKTYKKEGPSERTSFNGKQFEFFEPKNQKIQSSYGKQNKRNTRPWRQILNMNHVARKKSTEAKLKKAFRIKLFELCKTRSEKSSPDLFKFLETRLIMLWPMTMTGLPRAGAVSKPRDYKQNVQRMKGLLKKRALTGNSFKVSNQKTKKSNHLMDNKTKTTRPWRQKLNMKACSQEEINLSKIEKSIQNKTVWTLQV